MVPTPASTVAALFEAAFPFEDPEAPPFVERAVALKPFWRFARARGLVALPREPLLLPRALFDLALGPLELRRAAFALTFEALAPFLVLEPPEDARVPTGDDFR